SNLPTDSATITNGGNTLTLTTNPTSTQFPGTFSSAITAASANTTPFRSGGNTLTLTDGSATGAGTFTGNVRNTGIATITNGGNSFKLPTNPTPAQIAGPFPRAIAAAAVRAASLAVTGNTLILTDGSAMGA